MNGGYVLALVTIMIGPLVGVAVRLASRGRGGWAYQVLAIAITYLAIVSTYTPAAVEATLNDNQGQASHASVTSGAELIEAHSANANEPSLARFAATVAIISLTICAAPLLVGAQNAIALVFIAVGLYPAWRINRRAPA